MLDKRTGDEAAAEDSKDALVLMLLLSEGDQRPWSVAEFIRELDDGEVVDALIRLERGGLIHRTVDDLFFPTRAAIYCSRLNEQL